MPDLTAAEREAKKRWTVAVDVDGVIHSYATGLTHWKEA